jgi:putative acetyltransferase
MPAALFLATVRAVDVREEQPGDRESVRDVHLRAFGDHGALVADLVDDLRAGGALSLVAQRDGQVVGHVMFSRVLLDAPRRLVEVQTLSPLGVLPSHQRQGIGSALVPAGLRAIAERGVPVVFVEGDPHYYTRFGFVAGAGLGFRRPSVRIPEAAFQAITLPAYEPWMTGTMVYSEAFWRHDAVGIREDLAHHEAHSPDAPPPPTGGQGPLDPGVDRLLLTVDAVRIDPQEHRHAVTGPAGNLGSGNPAVEPERHGGVAQVVRPSRQG